MRHCKHLGAYLVIISLSICVKFVRLEVGGFGSLFVTVRNPISFQRSLAKVIFPDHAEKIQRGFYLHSQGRLRLHRQ